MKIFHLIVVFMCALAIHAETLKLRYATTVLVFDDAGKRIGTRTLKAGTEIKIPNDETQAPIGQKPQKLKSSSKVGELAPTKFIMQKRTGPNVFETPRAFLSSMKLEADPVHGDYLLADHVCIRGTIYGRRTSSSESVEAFVKKDTPTGKKVQKVFEDGGDHTAVIMVHFETKTDKDGEKEHLIFIDDVEELPGKSPYDILPD